MTARSTRESRMESRPLLLLVEGVLQLFLAPAGLHRGVVEAGDHFLHSRRRASRAGPAPGHVALVLRMLGPEVGGRLLEPSLGRRTAPPSPACTAGLALTSGSESAIAATSFDEAPEEALPERNSAACL